MNTEKIMGYVAGYAPTVLCFAVIIYVRAFVAKAIKRIVSGLNSVNVELPIQSLKTDINAKYNAFCSAVDVCRQESKTAQQRADDVREEYINLKKVVIENNTRLELMYREQQEYIKELIQDNVKLRADIRRKKDDGAGVQKAEE